MTYILIQPLKRHPVAPHPHSLFRVTQGPLNHVAGSNNDLLAGWLESRAVSCHPEIKSELWISLILSNFLGQAHTEFHLKPL